MYNRYVPQPDGSYRRNRMQDHCPPPPKPTAPEPPCQSEPPCPPPKPQGCDNFLRQLLPQGFDTGDLIVVLLLLLMAGDGEESRNNALLTLALYFLM